MKVKRFEAGSVKEAIERVKSELGPDAVILSIKERKQMGGLLGRSVEVLAACDMGSPSDSERFKKVDPQPQYGELVSEIRELKAMVVGLAGSMSNRGSTGFPFKLEGPSPEIASGIVEVLREALLTGIDPNEVTLGAILSKLLSRIMKGGDEDSRSIFYFVGPSGVGKTSSSLKIAFKMKEEGKRVAIVGVDMRPSSKELLFYYSRKIGVDVYFARSPQEFCEVLSDMDGFDVALVDTFGVSPFNRFQLGELMDYIEPFRDRAWCYLVLGASMDPRACLRLFESIGHPNIDSLIFTKMDETDVYASMFDQMVVSGKPISYLSFGPRIPDDLDIATPQRVAELLLRRGVNYGSEEARTAL